MLNNLVSISKGEQWRVQTAINCPTGRGAGSPARALPLATVLGFLRPGLEQGKIPCLTYTSSTGNLALCSKSVYLPLKGCHTAPDSLLLPICAAKSGGGVFLPCGGGVALQWLLLHALSFPLLQFCQEGFEISVLFRKINDICL